MQSKKYIYFFGSALTKGKAKDKLLLGGKGANLGGGTCYPSRGCHLGTI